MMLSVIVPSVVAPSKSSVILKLTLMPRNVIELDTDTSLSVRKTLERVSVLSTAVLQATVPNTRKPWRHNTRHNNTSCNDT
jgi:hypothetical protein